MRGKRFKKNLSGRLKDFQKNRQIQNYPTITIIVIARKKSNSRNRGEHNQGNFYSAKI